jgi:hypothetical protein
MKQLPHLVGNRRALANAFVRLAGLLEAHDRTREAQQSYLRAAAVQETLAEDFPTVAEYRQELVASHESLVPLLESAGRERDAQEHRRAAEQLEEHRISKLVSASKHKLTARPHSARRICFAR